VVAISQIFPLGSTNLKKIINKHIWQIKKNAVNLQLTYQERRRDRPFDVLATLKSWVLIPTPNGGR
jgi:hypothetical protein